jgi:hypothetical protein
MFKNTGKYNRYKLRNIHFFKKIDYNKFNFKIIYKNYKYKIKFI